MHLSTLCLAQFQFHHSCLIRTGKQKYSVLDIKNHHSLKKTLVALQINITAHAHHRTQVTELMLPGLASHLCPAKQAQNTLTWGRICWNHEPVGAFVCNLDEMLEAEYKRQGQWSLRGLLCSQESTSRPQHFIFQHYLSFERITAKSVTNIPSLQGAKHTKDSKLIRDTKARTFKSVKLKSTAAPANYIQRPAAGAP